MARNGILFRHEFVAMTGEYVGTTMFLFMGFMAAQVANLPAANTTTASGSAYIDPAKTSFIALAFGFSLVINVWIFFRVSGALFNPAVSLCLALAKVISPLRAGLLLLSQIAGGITAAALVSALTPGPLNVGNRLGDGVSVAQGLFIEALLTAQLVLTIFMVAVQKHKSTFLAPLAIGFTLFVAHLAGIHFTGASLNPARSFGPDLITLNFPSYHWIYWLGPALGGIFSTGIYTILKATRYHEVCGAEDRDETMLVARIHRAPYEDVTGFQGVREQTLRSKGSASEMEVTIYASRDEIKDIGKPVMC